MVSRSYLRSEETMLLLHNESHLRERLVLGDIELDDTVSLLLPVFHRSIQFSSSALELRRRNPHWKRFEPGGSHIEAVCIELKRLFTQGRKFIIENSMWVKPFYGKQAEPGETCEAPSVRVNPNGQEAKFLAAVAPFHFLGLTSHMTRLEIRYRDASAGAHARL